MSVEDRTSPDTALKPTPDIGAKPDDIRTFLDSRIPYQSVARTRRASTWTKATRYREAHQWLEPSFNRSTAQTPHWTDIEYGPGDDDYIPTPTQPEIFVHLSNEAARLGKPEFEPYVRPDGENPDVLARKGAKLSERALQNELKDMNWEEIEADADMDMPLLGQSILMSYWETDSTKTTRIPVTTAKACPRHPAAMKPAAPPVAAPIPPAPPVPPEAPLAPEAPSPDVVPPPALESTPDTALGAKSPAELMEPEPVPPPVEAEPEEECDFVTCKPEIDADTAVNLPPEALSVVEGEKVPGIEPKHKVDACPQCEDHPPLVDFYPSDKEAATGKDSFDRPLGEDKATGCWRLRTISPHDLFLQSMGVGIKFDQVQYFTIVTPMPVSWIATHLGENGKFVKPENAQAIMEWHPAGGERAVYESGDGALFQDFARVKEYHEKPSERFRLGRSIIMAGNQVLLDSTFLVPSQTVPGETFERVCLELIPWEKRSHECFGLSMSELLFSLQEDINEERSMEADLCSRMGTMFWMATRGMDLDTVALEGGGYSGKVVEYSPDLARPNAEPKPVGGEDTADRMVNKVQFFIEAMGRISGSSEPETGPPSGSPWSSVALQFQAEKSGERRGNRMRRKRKALERLFTHGLKLMYHRCLEPRKLRFEDADGQFKERAWKGIEFNGQIRVTIDAESEHDTAFQKQQKLMDSLDKNLYDLQNPAVRDKILMKLELPRDIEGQMETQRSKANREFCEFRDTDKEPVVDESIDDPQIHHDQHGLDILSEEFSDLEEAAQWDTIYPFLCDWKMQFQGLEMQLQASGVQRPPLLEHRIVAAQDLLLLLRGIDTRALPPDQVKALRKVMRFRSHFDSHTFKAELDAQMAAMGAPPLAAPGAQETASGTMPTPGQPAVAQPGTMAPAAAQVPQAPMPQGQMVQ